MKSNVMLACLLGGALSLSLAGCQSTSAIFSNGRVLKTTSQQYPKTNPRDVKIYFNQKPSCKHYKVIGEVSVMTVNLIGLNLSSGRLVHDLKKAAAKSGGNAIINLRDSFEHKEGTVIRCVS